MTSYPNRTFYSIASNMKEIYAIFGVYLGQRMMDFRSKGLIRKLRINVSNETGLGFELAPQGEP